MIYLDNGATSFRQAAGVYRAVERAMYTCAKSGEAGIHNNGSVGDGVCLPEAAAELFHCRPEQV